MWFMCTSYVIYRTCQRMHTVIRTERAGMRGIRQQHTALYVKYPDKCVTNWGKAGLGWRPARPTTAYQDFSKNRHNPVMVYNDLMIRNITVHNYNKDRSQPVTIQCLYTWVGAPVDRRRQTGMICPNRALILVRIIVPFFRMASRPLSASHQLILAMDIV